MNHNSKYNKDDQTISRLVQAVQLELPQEIDNKLIETLKANTKVKTWSLKRRLPKLSRLLYPAAALVGAMVLLVILTPLASPPAPKEPVISEIRTEFELKDKNIKIIWFQKKDFKLRRNTHES